MRAPKVIVIGSLNCDLAVVVPKFPEPGQTILGGSASLTIGGKGLNQAVAAASSGARTHLIGCVGNDQFGARIMAYLASTTVEASDIQSVEGATSGVAVITVDHTGANMIAVAPGANSTLSGVQVKHAIDRIERADVILAQLEVPIQAVAAALLAGRNQGSMTVLNPAPADRRILRHLALVDILTPNETELAELTATEPDDVRRGGSGFEKAVKQLQGLSGGIVVATRGSAGSVAFDGTAFTKVEAFPCDVADTIGAGDVFNGYLAAFLGEGCTLEDAMHAASAAASFAVTRPSAQGSAPTRNEIAGLLARHPGPTTARFGDERSLAGAKE